MSHFIGEYCSELNSEDTHDPEVALLKHKPVGGTMVMWRRSLDKYVSIHPVSTTAFLPLVYRPPGSPVSIHISLYLATSGKEIDFTEQITLLNNCIDDLREMYEGCLIFIRGDGNVNHNNHERMKILSIFLSNNNLVLTKIDHKCYHHFLGGGAFDSNIDIIAHSSESPHSESVSAIFCGQENPEIESHHDPILSNILLPFTEPQEVQNDLPDAPRIHQTRHRIIWSEEGVTEYQEQVAIKLSKVRQKWLNPLSKTSLSVLLSSTNYILNEAAISTNRSVNLNKKKNLKSKLKSVSIRKTEKRLHSAYEELNDALNDKNCNTNFFKTNLKEARKNHRKNIRTHKNNSDNENDRKLFSIMTSNPSAAFTFIKSTKSSSHCQIPFIQVGEDKFIGDKVSDGLFFSISKLKMLDLDRLESSPYHTSLMEDYESIKYLCSHKFDLPAVSLETSSDILLKMKPTVNDFFSITPKHFINAGSAGFVHFNLLMNAFIIDVNNSTIEELNTIFAILLYKGHDKERTLDSSYRTISTCPVVAKGLDSYVRELFVEKWNMKQAETQYQGQGSSHELASLLITEAVQHSKFTIMKPIFLLFLDAKSAFDNVIIPYLVRCFHQAGMEGSSVLYMENRLANRLTFCEYDKVFTGPIRDQQGLEQGGLSSSDCYKLYNNDCLNQAQQSNLGVELGPKLTISAVGQADDTVLLSNDLHKLKLILHLTTEYCLKYNVQLSPTKTKLVQIVPPRTSTFVPFNPITMFDNPVELVQQAEHVGVIRSSDGNLPNLLQRFSSFRKALGSIMSCGLARRRRSNPAASLRILSLYGTPVLMSGLASLFLSPTEISTLDQQYKRTVQSLLKLSTRSPAPLVHFISGTLPGTAVLHLRQLSLFSMICHLPGDPLHQHAWQVLLTCSPSAKSWFLQVRNLCLQYHLPHPMTFLERPPSKDVFKKLIKAKVVDYWEDKLRMEASFLP